MCWAKVSCSNPQAAPDVSLAKVTRPAPTVTRSAFVDGGKETSGAHAQSEKAEEAESVAPLQPFPPGIRLHTPEDISVPGDRPLRVAHAPAEVDHAVIYLHGMCGDPEGADPWIDIATESATVITVRANIKCPDRPGYKWPKEPAEIQPRIDAALEIVKALRNGHLRTDQVTLIGYSQGSHRGEKLATAFPEKYADLVLGGPPTPADPALLARAQSVAVLGGELEDTSHMVAGQMALEAAGIRSKFFLLPNAPHGSYGPHGRRVMREVLSWLWPNSR